MDVDVLCRRTVLPHPAEHGERARRVPCRVKACCLGIDLGHCPTNHKPVQHGAAALVKAEYHHRVCVRLRARGKPRAPRRARTVGHRQLMLLVEARSVLVEGRVHGEQAGIAFYGLAEERAFVCMRARFGLGLGEEDREGVEDEFV